MNREPTQFRSDHVVVWLKLTWKIIYNWKRQPTYSPVRLHIMCRQIYNWNIVEWHVRQSLNALYKLILRVIQFFFSILRGSIYCLKVVEMILETVTRGRRQQFNKSSPLPRNNCLTLIVFPEIIEKNIAWLILNLHSLLLINDIANPIITKDNFCTSMKKL